MKRLMCAVLFLLFGCSSKRVDNWGLWSDIASIGDGTIEIIQKPSGEFICVYTEFGHKEDRFGIKSWRGVIEVDR